MAVSNKGRNTASIVFPRTRSATSRGSIWTVVASGVGHTMVGTLTGEDGMGCTFIGALGKLPEVDCAG